MNLQILTSVETIVASANNAPDLINGENSVAASQDAAEADRPELNFSTGMELSRDATTVKAEEKRTALGFGSDGRDQDRTRTRLIRPFAVRDARIAGPPVDIRERALSEASTKSVGELRSLVKNGEERVFKRAAEPAGDEPDFYRASTRGEFRNVFPQWLNPPPQDNRPRPKTRFIADEYTPLATMEPPFFSFAGRPDQFADLLLTGVFYYLLSNRLADLILDRDPRGVEAIGATVRFEDGHSEPYKLLMPVRVLDAVDTAKTEVTVHSREAPKGSGRFRTDIWYHKGYTLRSDQLREIETFVEEFRCDWLWRADLVHAAAKTGATGLLFSDVSKTKPDIRF